MRTRAATVLVLVLTACGDPPGGDTLLLERAMPDHGPLGGGARIALTGAGFLANTAAPNRVLIAGREAPLVRTLDDATLEVVIPPGEQPGDAEIVVLNRNGNATATGLFRYSTPPTIDAVAPDRVEFSSSSTVITVTGTGFLAEGAGVVNVLVDGQLATDVEVISDTRLTFTAPPGPALVRPDIEVIDDRGSALARRAFHYAPGARGGLLLFPGFSTVFALFYDPVDNSTIAIPRVGQANSRFTAVVVDDQGDYWGLDRSLRFGRIDMRTHTLEASIQVQGWIPTMIRVAGAHVAIDRSTQRFGTVDPVTGTFTAIGDPSIPCCGSFGLASDGTTLYFTGRRGGTIEINTLDRTTGVAGTPVTLTGPPGFHIEEMRFFESTLYAASRDGSLVSIDPTTGAVTVLVSGIGRHSAMEVFE